PCSRWVGDSVAAMAADLARVTSSNTSRSWEAYPLTVSIRLGMRSYRRRSSVSMLAHELRISWRWLTKRFRDTIRARATSTTTPITMYTAITAGILLGGALGQDYRLGRCRTRSRPRGGCGRGTPGGSRAAGSARAA